MDLDDGGVDHGVFQVGLVRAGRKQPQENIGFDPAAIPLEDRVPPAKAGRQLTPRAARAHHPQHGLDEAAMVAPASPGVRRLAQTMRFHLRSLGVRQYEPFHPAREPQPGAERNAESQQALVGALGDADEHVRQVAAHAVGLIRPASVEAVPQLAVALRDSDKYVRLAAAEALSAIGPTAAQAVPELAATFGNLSKNWDVRRAAADALERIGPAAAKAIPVLAAALSGAEWDVRRAAAGALAGIRPEAVPKLCEALGNDGKEALQAAVEMLPWSGPAADKAAATPADALRDSDERVRQAAAQAAQDGEGSVPTIKVMTWNVENLFVPARDAASEVKELFERKLVFLAATITRLDPDLVALQELGGEAALQALQDGLAGGYAERRISAFPDQRGIAVGFLSRLPIEASEDFVDLPPGPALQLEELDGDGQAQPVHRMSRGALRVRVTKAGFSTDVITAHLKSKLLSFPRPGGRTSFAPRDEDERAQVAGTALRRRAAEAVTLRMRVTSLLGQATRAPLVLLGDLNDVADAATTQILLGPPGSELDTGGFDRQDAGDVQRLFNLAPAIPEARRFSRVYHGGGELIDQILASQEFFPRGDDGHRKLPIEVDSHVDVAGGLRSIADEPTAEAGQLAPDHAPVTATFAL